MARKKLTKREFITFEAGRCGVTEKYLTSILDIEKCNCEHWICPGWITVDKRNRKLKELPSCLKKTKKHQRAKNATNAVKKP